MKSWHIYFSGRVQGVGFRHTCQLAASRFGLSGWVKNLADGRVELVVEGDPVNLEAMLVFVREHTHGEILNLEKSQVDAIESAEYSASGFQIRR